MVQRSSTCKAMIPMRGVMIQPHTKSLMTGKGMGSVLLMKGGPGGASSYQDIDDFIQTTGIDPFSKSRKVVGSGMKGKKLTEKLEKLTILTPSTKRRNITM